MIKSRYNTDRAEREEYGSALGRNFSQIKNVSIVFVLFFSGAGSREKRAGGSRQGERKGGRA